MDISTWTSGDGFETIENEERRNTSRDCGSPLLTDTAVGSVTDVSLDFCIAVDNEGFVVKPLGTSKFGEGNTPSLT